MELAVKERLLVNTGCPRCGSYSYGYIEQDEEGDGGYHHCYTCGRDFGFMPIQDTNHLKGTTNDIMVKADKGCKTATKKIGEQSSCIKCPFPKCLFCRDEDEAIATGERCE